MRGKAPIPLLQNFHRKRQRTAPGLQRALFAGMFPIPFPDLFQGARQIFAALLHFSVPNVNTSVCCIPERAQKPGKKMLHCPKIRAMQGAAGLYQANRAPDHLPGQKKSGIGNAGRRNTSGTPYATSKCYRNSPTVFKERP